MAAGIRLVPFTDLEELSEVFTEGKTQRQELELLVSFDRSSQGKRPFLWKHHDLKEKNTESHIPYVCRETEYRIALVTPKTQVESQSLGQPGLLCESLFQQSSHDRSLRDGLAAKNICSFKELRFTSQNS